MLYEIAHLLRSHCNFIWEWMEGLNSFAFRCRYRTKLAALNSVLQSDGNERVRLRNVEKEDVADLVQFFANQPESAYAFFKPHEFDEKTLSVLQRRTSFLMYIAVIDDEIVGYYFLRSFVHGQCFLGKMVDVNHQGQGIGKMMCLSAMRIAQHVGLRMFESISKRNIASMRSSSAVLKQVIIEELEGDDLLIEDLPLTNDK